MKATIAKNSKTSFCGILRTPRGSVILVAVENMPIAPTGALTVATNCPYSHPAEPQEGEAGVGQSIYIGQVYDGQTQLSYLNARYYNGSQGQFTSQDPTVLAIGDPNKIQQLIGLNQTMVLSNPQALNMYSYAGDNPVTYKDPDGKFFGVDDAAGFIIGGAIGSITYLGLNFVTGQNSTWGGVGGSFVSGGIIGVGAVNTPETLGASDAIALAAVTGLAAGAAGDATKQGIDISTGVQKKINPGEIIESSVLTGATGGLGEGFLPASTIPYLSEGQGSYSSIGQEMLTKGTNGTIQNISVSTGVKSAVGSQASSLYQTLAGILVQLTQILSTLSNSNNTGKSSH